MNDANIGSNKNFEKAISLCEGEIIALCDQDDFWQTDKLEKISASFDGNENIGYVFSDADVVDENLTPLGITLWDSFGFRGEFREKFDGGDQVNCFLRQQLVTGATMAFRAELKNIVMPFPVDTIWLHDGWIAFMASATGALGMPLPDKLILYRQHSAQQAGILSSVKRSTRARWDSFKGDKLRKADTWRMHADSYLYSVERLMTVNQEDKKKTISVATEEIKQAALHFSNRATIYSTSGFEKFYILLEEALSGRYRKFANPYKSIFSDIFV